MKRPIEPRPTRWGCFVALVTDCSRMLRLGVVAHRQRAEPVAEVAGERLGPPRQADRLIAAPATGARGTRQQPRRVTWSPAVATYRLSKSPRAPSKSSTIAAHAGREEGTDGRGRVRRVEALRGVSGQGPGHPRVSTMRRIGRRAASGRAFSSFLAWRSRAFVRDPGGRCVGCWTTLSLKSRRCHWTRGRRTPRAGQGRIGALRRADRGRAGAPGTSVLPRWRARPPRGSSRRSP